jgi:hypothetical protein
MEEGHDLLEREVRGWSHITAAPIPITAATPSGTCARRPAAVQLLVSGLLMIAGIACGSRGSAISNRVADRLASMGKFCRIGATGASEAIVQLTVGGIAKPFRVSIVHGLQWDCLLGEDFLQETGIMMDYSSRPGASGVEEPWYRS